MTGDDASWMVRDWQWLGVVVTRDNHADVMRGRKRHSNLELELQDREQFRLQMQFDKVQIHFRAANTIHLARFHGDRNL